MRTLKCSLPTQCYAQPQPNSKMQTLFDFFDLFVNLQMQDVKPRCRYLTDLEEILLSHEHSSALAVCLLDSGAPLREISWKRSELEAGSLLLKLSILHAALFVESDDVVAVVELLGLA